ncbi:MAG: aminotransferase class V-fold PLP-dependent enzyme, partial [Pirellula sp.]
MNEVQLSSAIADFPALAELTPSGKPLIYLDSAATALRPKAVIDAVVDSMVRCTGGVHRSVNFLGDRATELYEQARVTVAQWVRGLENELVFTRNTTESLNLIAKGWPDRRRILVSATDHHSAILSWDRERTLLIGPTDRGAIDVDRMEKELSCGDVAIVCLSHVSNVTGSTFAVDRLAKMVHRYGGILVLDAAQSAPHGPMDVQQLDCDFLAFSGHKLGSPAGIGVLWGKAECLQRLDTVFQGGGVIESIRGQEIKYKDNPWRLEAGTPAIEAAAGLAAAIDYLRTFDPNDVIEHQKKLRTYAIDQLRGLPKLKLVCDESSESLGPVSFYFEGLPSHFVARTLSDSYGICIRSGYQCAEPLHRSLGIDATLRISFFLY